MSGVPAIVGHEAPTVGITARPPCVACGVASSDIRRTLFLVAPDEFAMLCVDFRACVTRFARLEESA